MNKFVLGALALTAASSPSLAGSDNEWLTADAGIENLAARLAPAASGASLSAFLKSSYLSADKGDFGGFAGDDTGGFNTDNARMVLTGGNGDFGILVEADAVGGGAQGVYGQTNGLGGVYLLDAYGTWVMGTSGLTLQAGTFRAPFLASALRAENNLLFMDRSLLGNNWAGRDQGVQVSGAWGKFRAMLAFQNGFDGAAADLAMCLRGEFTAMGTASAHEGAFGATNSPTLTLGAAAYIDDQDSQNFGSDDRSATGFDASFAVGIFSASAEIVDFGGDDAAGSIGLGVPADFITNATPWNVAVSVMAVPKKLEFGLRYEDLDDDENSTVFTFGANFYPAESQNTKFQLNFSSADSDDDFRKGDVVQLGMTVSV